MKAPTVLARLPILLLLVSCAHGREAALPPPLAEPPSDQESSSPVSPIDVAPTVRSHLRVVQSCYERELTRSPRLEGKVELRFTIGTTGRVTRTEVATSTLPPAIGECLRTHVGAIRFPVKLDQEVTVSFPFVFSPGSR